MPTSAAIARRLGRLVAAVPSPPLQEEVVRRIYRQNPQRILEAIGSELNRAPELRGMPLDLEPRGKLEFEDLAGLFASNSLNHGLVGMTIRQVAYLFGLARRLPARTAIEIGRWRGGTTIALAAGMGAGSRLWSIDIGEKEARLLGRTPGSFDEQTREFCERFGLNVELIVGDSRSLELETGEVDLVLIDGDHSYEGVRTDYERFGRRVRVGGALVLDDAFDEAVFPTHEETVGRLVREVIETGAYRLVKSVDRLAHLERIR